VVLVSNRLDGGCCRARESHCADGDARQCGRKVSGLDPAELMGSGKSPRQGANMATDPVKT